MKTEPRIKLHPAWDYMAAGHTAELWDSRSGKRFRITAEADIERIFSAFAEGIPQAAAAAEIANHLGMSQQDADGLVRSLSDSGVLYIPANISGTRTGLQRTRTDPILTFFAQYETSQASADEYLRRFQSATVLVMGLGGYGTWVTQTLCMMGVGMIIGVDGDVVEASNLGRQAMYRPQDVGRAKAEVVGETVAELNPAVTYRAVARRIRDDCDIAETLASADVVVLPFSYIGRHPTRDMIARLCVQLSVPFLPIGLHAIGPFWRDRPSACYRCLLPDPRTPSLNAFAQDRAQGRINENTYLPWAAESAQRAVDEIARYVTGFLPPLTENRVVMCNAADRSGSHLSGVRDPGCAICGQGAPE